jgi:predicted CopG family antitoxin
MVGKMIYIPDDIFRDIERIQHELGIKSASDSLRVLLKKKERGGNDNFVTFRI